MVCFFFKPKNILKVVYTTIRREYSELFFFLLTRGYELHSNAEHFYMKVVFL